MTAPHRTAQRPSDASARHHNLPAPHTHLIGREHDCATVLELVQQTPGRLVTLTGTGGCGKTQLALLVAAGLVDRFADGVWLVDLAPVQAPNLVLYAVAAVLGRRERAGEALLDTLLAYLTGRELVLVLDNCEHLIDACAGLAERLLSGCPMVRVLATSREQLRIGGEVTWRVPSLAIPDPGAALSPADLLAYPAVRLFVDRVKAVQRDFTLGPTNASSVAGVCARLEGLPLALELAAARMPTLSLPQILERLNECFRLLVGGSRTAPTRQQTLRATLDWSYELLTPAEQAVFRRLAVFAGGWTLEAAELVCSDGAVNRADVLELLSHLVDKSLVLAGERDRSSRYRLLEPLRQYAWEQLTATAELNLVRERHAATFLALAEALERDANVGGAERGVAVEGLEGEYRNLQVALRWALDSGDADVGLRLARTLQFVWKFRLPGEGRLWIGELLRLPGADAPTPVRAVALLTAAWLIWDSDANASAALYAEALPLARRLGDPWILFVAMADKGMVAQYRGDYDTARACWEEGLVVTQASGDRASEAVLLNNLGRLAIFRGDYVGGRPRCAAALHLARALGDSWAMTMALDALALAALVLGDSAAAHTLAGECLSLHKDGAFTTGALRVLAQIEMAEGRHIDARQLLGQALAIAQDGAEPWTLAFVIDTLASLAAHLERPDLALRLVAAVERALAARGIVEFTVNRDLRDRWLIPLQKTLSPNDATRWWAEGYALSLDEAVALAQSSPLAAVSSPDPWNAPTVTGPVRRRQLEAARLTDREAEVLRLVARGQSNKEIAAELVLSVRTVERHITNLYGKIDARGKADATAYAFKHGLL